MGKQANPTLIGAFVTGAVTLLTAAIIMFGGDAIFSQREEVVMYFGGSVDGLNVGAPVTVRGVEIGTVTAINLQFNTDTGELRIPVIAELDAGSIEQARQLKVDDPIKAIIEELGLRAQLKIQSLLTSQLFIQLDYHPGSELHYYGDGSILEVPTIPMPIQQIDKVLNDISIEQMLTDISSSLSAINRLVNSPELAETVTNMRDAFASVDRLSNQISDTLVPLAETTNATMTEARDALRGMKTTLENLKHIVDDDSPYLRGMEEALTEITSAARTLSNLQEIPQMQKLDTALDEITLAARQVRTLEDSPQMMNLNTAMEELARASRAVRILADTIEQQPEILLKGKSVSP